MFTRLAFAALALLALPALAYAEDVCPELNALQRAAGYVTLKTSLWTLGVVGVGVGVTLFFGGVIAKVVKELKAMLSVGALVLSVAAIVGAWFVGPEYQGTLAFIGSVMFGGSVLIVLKVFEMESDDPRSLFALYMIVWGLTAAVYTSTAVGFLAVGALMGILGFSFGVGRLSYAFGWEDEHGIPQAIFVGVIMLVFYTAQYVMINHYGVKMPAGATIFSTGALWLGSFVTFLGLLIMSFRRRHGVLGMQVVTATALGATYVIGTFFAVSPLPGMALAFGILFTMSKCFEFRMDDAIRVGIAVAASGSILLGSYYLITSNDALTREFLALAS